MATDAEEFEALRQLRILDSNGPEPADPPAIKEVLDTLEKRLKRKLEGRQPHLVCVSLAPRLQALRRAKIDSAAASTGPSGFE